MFFYKTVHFWIFHLIKLEKLKKSENLNIAAHALISFAAGCFVELFIFWTTTDQATFLTTSKTSFPTRSPMIQY